MIKINTIFIIIINKNQPQFLTGLCIFTLGISSSIIAEKTFSFLPLAGSVFAALLGLYLMLSLIIPPLKCLLSSCAPFFNLYRIPPENLSNFSRLLMTEVNWPITAMISFLSLIFVLVPFSSYPLAGLPVSSSADALVALVSSLGLSLLVGMLLPSILFPVLALLKVFFQAHFLFGLPGIVAFSFIYGSAAIFLQMSVPDFIWILIAISFPLLTLFMALSAQLVLYPFLPKQLFETNSEKNQPLNPKGNEELQGPQENQNRSSEPLPPPSHTPWTTFCASLCFLISLMFWILILVTITIGVGSTSLTAKPEFSVPPPSGIPNPKEKGPYEVKSWAYFEEGAEAWVPPLQGEAPSPLILSEGYEVDFSPIFNFSSVRTKYWGFSSENIPLRGLLWAPDPSSPSSPPSFPVVIVSAGNHQMTESSEEGYEYLCQHLASHGFACISFEADFMNSVLLGSQRIDELRGSFSNQMLGRALLYLEHGRLLNQLAEGIVSPANPLQGKLDLSCTLLIGHSRSGEAISIASWALEQHEQPLPGNLESDLPANLVFPEFPQYNLSLPASSLKVCGLVAFAPTDSTFVPGGKPISLSRTNYLTIQGTHDVDQANTFQGLRQYQGANVDKEGAREFFASSLYVYRCNHGQWNTVWGDEDVGPTASWFLAKDQLLSAQEQQGIAKLYVAAFGKMVLEDDDAEELRELFVNPRSADSWIASPTTIASVYKDSRTSLVSDFDEAKGGNLYHCSKEEQVLCRAKGNPKEWDYVNRDERIFSILPDRAAKIVPDSEEEEAAEFSLSWIPGTFQPDPSLNRTETPRLTFELGSPSNIAFPSSDILVSVALSFNSTPTDFVPLEGSRALLPFLQVSFVKAGTPLGGKRVIMLDHFEIPFNEFSSGSVEELSGVTFRFFLLTLLTLLTLLSFRLF